MCKAVTVPLDRAEISVPLCNRHPRSQGFSSVSAAIFEKCVIGCHVTHIKAVKTWKFAPIWHGSGKLSTFKSHPMVYTYHMSFHYTSTTFSTAHFCLFNEQT